MAYEVEMKFPIQDLSELRRQLMAIGAVSVGSRTEVDTYLSHPARSFAETDEALRVRQSNAEVFLTYKGPKIAATTKTRIEIELKLAASQTSLADVIQFWQRLGFSAVQEVSKEREVLELAWRCRTIHASLDRVQGVGNFLELELSAEPAQVEESRQLLISLAEQLKLENSERRSYLELLLENIARSAYGPRNSEDWQE